MRSWDLISYQDELDCGGHFGEGLACWDLISYQDELDSGTVTVSPR